MKRRVSLGFDFISHYGVHLKKSFQYMFLQDVVEFNHLLYRPEYNKLSTARKPFICFSNKNDVVV